MGHSSLEATKGFLKIVNQQEKDQVLLSTRRLSIGSLQRVNVDMN